VTDLSPPPLPLTLSLPLMLSLSLSLMLPLSLSLMLPLSLTLNLNLSLLPSDNIHQDLTWPVSAACHSDRANGASEWRNL